MCERERYKTNNCFFWFTVLIALTTNTESVEFKQIWNMNNQFPIKHPRACTTDDVKSFFSVLRDAVGKKITLKMVQNEMRKVYIEYNKRQDHHLPYYYHTSSHEIYYEGHRPQFSEPPKKQKEKRIENSLELLCQEEPHWQSMANSR